MVRVCRVGGHATRGFDGGYRNLFGHVGAEFALDQRTEAAETWMDAPAVRCGTGSQGAHRDLTRMCMPRLNVDVVLIAWMQGANRLSVFRLFHRCNDQC